MVRREPDKTTVNVQGTSLWPELWRGMSKNAKLREKQKWSNEKPKLDNARRLRGIYFIDPEDKEFKETIKNVRRKFERSVAPAEGQFTATLQFGSQIYSHASSHEDSRSKGSSVQGMDLTRVRSKSEVIDEARTKGAKVHY